MDKKSLQFDNFEIKECKFHQNTSLISINDIDINKVVVSNKLSLGKQDFRYFIGCKDDKKIRTLSIFIPKRSPYRIAFDETECIYFMIKEKNVFVKYLQSWEKVNNIIKKFNSELI